jgi:hypothetical protein
METRRDISELVEGKVIYLLIVVIAVQTLYPFSVLESPFYLILYQMLFGSLIAVGIYLARDTRLHTIVLSVLAVLWLITGPFFAFNQDSLWALLAAYVVIVAFELVVIQVMLRFIFGAKQVTRDVLYAATAVYFLLGALFVPIYGMINSVTYLQIGMNAFADALNSAEIFPWQSFVYYSYSTLTTLGYGDILPVTFWARSIASLEAIIGVLYLTIIMARLVGLYAQKRNDEAGEA